MYPNIKWIVLEHIKCHNMGLFKVIFGVQCLIVPAADFLCLVPVELFYTFCPWCWPSCMGQHCVSFQTLGDFNMEEKLKCKHILMDGFLKLFLHNIHFAWIFPRPFFFLMPLNSRCLALMNLCEYLFLVNEQSI